jgi:hypothetical protein
VGPITFVVQNGDKLSENKTSPMSKDPCKRSYGGLWSSLYTTMQYVIVTKLPISNTVHPMSHLLPKK